VLRLLLVLVPAVVVLLLRRVLRRRWRRRLVTDQLDLVERQVVHVLVVLGHELQPDLPWQTLAVDDAALGVLDRVHSRGNNTDRGGQLTGVADHPGLRVLVGIRLPGLVRTGLARAQIGRAHVCTPVTRKSRMPSS